MPLQFSDAKRDWDAPLQAVSFSGSDNGKPVRCLVTLDALVQHFGAPRNADGDQALRAFDRCRPVIEEQALVKHARRRLGPNGEVTLGARDF